MNQDANASPRTIVIGSGSGFWGDSALAVPQLLRAPRLDYIVFDYLAETTMSVLQRARLKDPELGYATDFVTGAVKPHLGTLMARGVRLVSNAGGLNPAKCRDALLALAREHCHAETIDYREDSVVAELRERTGGRGPDACIDAVGMEAHGLGLTNLYDQAKQAMRLQTDRPTALREALQACGKGGTVSIPGVYAPVSRKEKVTVQAYNLAGEEVSGDFEGLFARIIQHETDHLDGRLFIDRIEPLQRADISGQLEEFEIDWQSKRAVGEQPSDEQIAARIAELESQRT